MYLGTNYGMSIMDEQAGKFTGKLRAGLIGVNNWGPVPDAPFGGYKQSGFGRDLSLHALDKFTQLKTTWIKLS